MNKKTLLSLGTILLILTGVLSFFAIIKPTPITPTTEQPVQKSTLKIAVVNEDRGTTYNGEPVNMAKMLLKSLTTHSDYNVEEVTRAIAERGLENNTYQLMIVLPSKFSEESLAIESTTPTQVNFQYQMKSDKPLIVKQAEQAVLDFKSAFNKDLIHVYFLSIINNLQTAQSQVADVVTNESIALNSYQTNLSKPLHSYAKQFEGISGAPNSLLASYTQLDREINQTNEAFTSIVDVNKTYEAEIEQIRAQQESWKQALDEKSTRLLTYDKELSHLTVQEQLEQLKVLHKTLLEKFSEPMVWKDAIDKIEQFNVTLHTFIDKLKAINTEIDTAFANHDKEITDAIEESLKAIDTRNGAWQVQTTLGQYVKRLRTVMLSKIDQALYNGTYYDDEALSQLGLSHTDTQYLKNINTFIRWYTKENHKITPPMRVATHTQSHIHQIKQTAIENVTQTQMLSFEEIEGGIKELLVTVPSNYVLRITGYPSSKINDTTYAISVANKDVSRLDIQYTLQPIDSNQISLIEPIIVKGVLVTEQTLNEAVGEETTISKDKKKVKSDENNPNSKMLEIEVETKVIKQNTKPKGIQRKYTATQVLPLFTAYKEHAEARALYADIQDYLEVASLAKAFYDLNLHQPFEQPSESSLFKQTDIDELKTIITSLIKETTLTALKDKLKVSESELKAFEEQRVNEEVFKGTIDTLRTNTNDLVAQLSGIVTETEKIHATLQSKPIFEEFETPDNATLVTVSMRMNNDLMQLMRASRTLMDNTKSNQNISKTIQNTLETLTANVTNLEQEGVALSERVVELQNVMSKEYDSNRAFLQSFSTVLSNTKTGNQENTAVYNYLSNPVDASKIQDVLGVTSSSTVQPTRQDNRSALLIVVISYSVALIIAYLLQHADLTRLPKQLKTINRTHWKNATVPLLFLTVMASLAGTLIGTVSAIKLEMRFNQGLLFTLWLVGLMLTLTYGLNAMLTKAKSIGFLLAIVILVIYFMTAIQLFDAYYINTTEFLTYLSPLTYVEKGMSAYINQTRGNNLSFTVVMLLAFGLGAVNGWIYRQFNAD